MSGTSMMAGMGWFGMLLMLLLWGAALSLMIWGASSLFPSATSHVEDDALEILRRRYAGGEISRATFLQACESFHNTEREQPSCVVGAERRR